MLKSTYVPSAAAAASPLPVGWSEHKAPTGHTYYYNAETRESTYKRPSADLVSPPAGASRPNGYQGPAIPNLSDPAAANAWQAQFNPQPQNPREGFRGRGGHRGGHEGSDRPRPQPRDKPKSKTPIPGCEPWILVYTKYGRRFVFNPVKNASYWRIPEKIMKGVIDLDIQGAQLKAHGQKENPGDSTEDKTATRDLNGSEEHGKEQEAEAEAEEELGSDYEEVEVTDDEDEAGQDQDGQEDGDEHPSKRQRTEDPEQDDDPVEFDEADIAYQLQAMGEDYGLDPGEYDDGNAEEWPEGAEGLPVSDGDAKQLFKDLLNDFGISPYSSWDKLIEDGNIIDDHRYTVLPSTKARRETWEEWSREQIQVLKERRAQESKKDPRVPYLAFLAEKATPKLYWAEFRRKYRKEPEMRDAALSDKDREKLYRDYLARLKLPTETLKKDLTALLRSVSISELNNQTMLASLPAQLLADVRFISVDSSTRDRLIEGYISTLAPPPQ